MGGTTLSGPVPVDSEAPLAGRSSQPSPAAARLNILDRFLLGLLRRGLGEPALRVVLGDGEPVPLSDDAPVADLVIRDRRSLLAVLLDPDLRFGDEYAAGRVDIRGDLLGALLAVYDRWSHGAYTGRRDPMPRVRGNTTRRSREDIHHHYDIGNDFYRLWLDEEMVYTCAYFETPEADLEAAQRAKMEYVCRKLRLRPGERVLEAGCGWGALALYMAGRHGVSVRACNLSREQVRFARERARREGLDGRVEFVEADYRDMTGRFDAFVSVGMLEHVGRSHYPALAAVMDRCLGEGGRGLLHFIGRDRPGPLSAWIRRRIFPGAYPPTVSQVAREILEPGGFSLLDVENLRLHYARTLAHWRSRYESACETVSAMFDEAFTRTWRLYLAGSEAAFLSGWLQLFQVTFARSGHNGLPWTRSDLYP
jgi:cyclopropane-fatty-acyl-phospholipid synthase